MSPKRSILLAIVMYFSLVISMAQPSDFNLIAPSNYSVDVDIWPLLIWEESTDTCEVLYTLQISTTPKFTEGTYVSYDSISGTSMRPPVDLIMGEQLYYWRVLAISKESDTTQNNAAAAPFNFFQLQTIPESEPREILCSTPLQYNRTIITENSPYNLRQGNLVIPGSMFFIVQEGVRVEFEGDYYISVQGLLKLNGTEEAPIILIPHPSINLSNRWKSIRFSSTSVPSQFEGTEYLSGSVIKHVNFTRTSDTYAVIDAKNTPLFIDNCSFNLNNNTGGAIASIQAAVLKNTIKNCGGPGISLTGDYCLVLNNNLEDTKGSGLVIEGDRALIENNDMRIWNQNDNNGSGIHITGDSASVIKNRVSGYKSELIGGGIYVLGDTCLIDDNFVFECESLVAGGGIYQEGNMGLIQNNEVKACRAIGNGGGIASYGNNNRILDNEIHNCRADFTHQYYCTTGDLIVDGGYGGGLRVHGREALIQGNLLDSCSTYLNVYNTYSHSSRDGIANSYGGAVGLTTSKSVFVRNVVRNSRNEAVGGSRRGYNDKSQTFGGALYITGDSNTVAESEFINAEILGSSDIVNQYGAGVYITGTRNKFSNCLITNTSGELSAGGGLYTNDMYLVLDSCTISGCRSMNGAGVYFGGTWNIVSHSTITNNIASLKGGGIYGGYKILSSIVKYNQALQATGGGGVYGDPININYCNISKNLNYNLVKSSGSNTDATSNWWLTRSDEITIEEGIYDGDDTEGSLGFANYQPILTDASDSIPNKFSDADSLYLKLGEDFLISNKTGKVPAVGKVYFKLTGMDENPYSRDVAVIKVFNKMNWAIIRPFYEESTDSSGTWTGYFYVGNATSPKDTVIGAQVGDTLRISSDVDPEIFTEVVVAKEGPLSKRYGFCNVIDDSLSVNGTNVRWYEDDELKVVLKEGNKFLPVCDTTGTYFYLVTQTIDGKESAPSLVTLVISKPSIEFGDLITICPGDTINLDAGPGMKVYEWNIDSTGHLINVHTEGEYYVQATDEFGCTASDTVFVRISDDSVRINDLNSGTNKYICYGSSYLLDAGDRFVHYKWSTGDTTRFITVDSVARYSVSVVDSFGCRSSAEIQIYISNPVIRILNQPDTATSCNSSITLTTNTGFSSYYWSNGEKTETITAVSTGKYIVTGINRYGCIARDSIMLYFGKPLNINGRKARNHYYCSGVPVILDAGAGFIDYNWSNGENSQIITVDPVRYKEYTVTTLDSMGCQKSLSARLYYYDYKPSAAFEIDNKFGTRVQLDNNSYRFYDSDRTFRWEFGNGDSSFQVNPTYEYPAPGSYTISLFASSTSCPYYVDTATLEVSIDYPTSVGYEPGNEDLKVYPNPNTGVFYLEIPGSDTGPVELTITSSTGSVVMKRILPGARKTEINLSGMNSGIYYIKTTTTGKTYINTISIQ